MALAGGGVFWWWKSNAKKEKKDKKGLTIGAGCLLGLGVGFFLLERSALYFVACIMVGMGGFFAGVAKTPFASVIMVMELTGSYGLLVYKDIGRRYVASLHPAGQHRFPQIEKGRERAGWRHTRYARHRAKRSPGFGHQRGDVPVRRDGGR